MSRHLPRGAPVPIRLVTRACDAFLRHEMSTYAAALAYRGLLALFPFLIFVIALVNAFDAWRMFDMLAEWARSGPEGRVPATITAWLSQQARSPPDDAVLSVGAIAAVWAVASGARVLRGALNRVTDAPEQRPPWQRLVRSFVVAPALGTLILTAVVLFTLTSRVLLRASRWFDVNDLVLALWDWVRLPAGLLVAIAAVAALYTFGSSRPQTFRGVLPGAVLAAGAWAVASLVFSRAVSGLLQFGVTYGSFSAAIVLLVYLYFAAGGLLFGAELNAVLGAGSRTHGARERGGDDEA